MGIFTSGSMATYTKHTGWHGYMRMGDGRRVALIIEMGMDTTTV